MNIDVVGRDDVSEPNQFRLSNDGVTFKTFSYTSNGSFPTSVSNWNLTDPAYGGNSATGVKTVYAQVHDNSGKWGPTFTDTINFTGGGGGPPPPPPPSGPYSQGVQGDNPSGYWRLDEASGLNAGDSFGSNPGTYVERRHARPAQPPHERRRQVRVVQRNEPVRHDPELGSVGAVQHRVTRGVDQTDDNSEWIRVDPEQGRVVLAAIQRRETRVHDHPGRDPKTTAGARGRE